MFRFFPSHKKITEKLYAQNLELAVKNKTLSLLEKLYQTSVQTLTPKETAQKITTIIRGDLNLELAGVFVFEKQADVLTPLIFAKSERLEKINEKLGFHFKDVVVSDVAHHPFFKKVVYEQQEAITNSLEQVWQAPEHQGPVEEIKKESHVKTILSYPLFKGREVFGVLILGLNRDYASLSPFEKESIKNFTNVIALLLNKAYLYQDLQESYEITKKAYAVEKKSKEELENLDKTKNQFILLIQHNLRTPLTSMMGYSDLLISGAFGKQNKKTIDVIKRLQLSTRNLIKMVNDFLDITQFQLGKNVLTLKPGIELGPIFKEIENELTFEVESKHIYLRLKVPAKLPAINADSEKLKAALFNIIHNAIKYTVQGGVTVTVAAEDVVKITIADTGIGIAPENLPTLFTKMFERSEQAKKTSATGSGVGLFLAAQIIKYHNGKVWAESAGEGKGSTFHIELPLT